MNGLSLLLETASTSSTGAGGSIWGMLAIYAVFILILYFILIRPQRKQQKETQKMQDNVKNGDWVLLNDGMYGKVVNSINDCLIVELGTNKSVMVPVLRSQIAGVQEPNLSENKAETKDVEPTDAVVGDDVEEDGLSNYEKAAIEKGEKKKGLFRKKK